MSVYKTLLPCIFYLTFTFTMQSSSLMQSYLSKDDLMETQFMVTQSMVSNGPNVAYHCLPYLNLTFQIMSLNTEITTFGSTIEGFPEIPNEIIKCFDFVSDFNQSLRDFIENNEQKQGLISTIETIESIDPRALSDLSTFLGRIINQNYDPNQISQELRPAADLQYKNIQNMASSLRKSLEEPSIDLFFRRARMIHDLLSSKLPPQSLYMLTLSLQESITTNTTSLSTISTELGKLMSNDIFTSRLDKIEEQLREVKDNINSLTKYLLSINKYI